MSDIHPFIGQVIRVTEGIPENGIGAVVLSNNGTRVTVQAQSDTHLPVRVGSQVVVKEMISPELVVVSVNLPTPC